MEFPESCQFPFALQNSAGIIWSIWQAPLPNLIPLEFRELPGFRQESVEDNKDLGLIKVSAQCLE